MMEGANRRGVRLRGRQEEGIWSRHDHRCRVMGGRTIQSILSRVWSWQSIVYEWVGKGRKWQVRYKWVWHHVKP